ncbi:Putative Zinc finger, ZZ-type [Septoria linicola]|uniref:Zinc finger, ZZ-type n=1 Tax=Septoria linicola TaxID=215465 RepID=A0A9Q9EIQ2_9PEZI|nr:putative Zinc finger, ZZ-type [Septoria linicola]USW50583.1 Putative Zinc finger, ZZ-type [Septoria linicola]
MQVAREGQEEDELFAGWPAPAMQEDDPDVFMCDACDQPIDGMRHYCTHCPDLDFCDEHFVAGMKQHQLVEPNHIFDHQHVPKAAELSTVTGNAGERRVRGKRDDTPFASESPLNPETTRSNKLSRENDVGSPIHGKPNGNGRLQAASPARGATTPTPIPHPERKRGKQARPPSRRRSGKAPASVSDHDQPAPPQPRASSQHFASITEQLARSTPPRPVRHRTYTVEQTTQEAFAKKWLFHFHSYVRTWSEDANVAHAGSGMQMLHDFTADAVLNDFMPAHFASITGVEVAAQNRDYHFADPFQAASKARQLNQRSIEKWRVFRDRNGMIAGQVVATIGYVQLQEVDALLSRARELGRIDGWRAALPLLGHDAENP